MARRPRAGGWPFRIFRRSRLRWRTGGELASRFTRRRSRKSARADRCAWWCLQFRPDHAVSDTSRALRSIRSRRLANSDPLCIRRAEWLFAVQAHGVFAGFTADSCIRRAGLLVRPDCAVQAHRKFAGLAVDSFAQARELLIRFASATPTGSSPFKRMEYSRALRPILASAARGYWSGPIAPSRRTENSRALRSIRSRRLASSGSLCICHADWLFA